MCEYYREAADSKKKQVWKTNTNKEYLTNKFCFNGRQQEQENKSNLLEALGGAVSHKKVGIDIEIKFKIPFF